MPMRLQTVIRAIVAYGALSVTHSLWGDDNDLILLAA